MYDVIVVGGGIVGMSTAYHLVCAGARTLLIDREDQGRATDAGAGILSPETNSRDPDAWFDFAVAAVGYYPTLVQRLQEDQGGDTGYARCGQMVVAVSEDEFALFDRARSLILGRQERRGLPSIDDLYEISGSGAVSSGWSSSAVPLPVSWWQARLSQPGQSSLLAAPGHKPLGRNWASISR